ncbi:SDR family oxidoreductase [Nocardia sp. XZ_19_369]|uniref:SDR family oxidoreductase n=1 Tax=Nocardia sp. XZ_19_369 TaxID=2769487 RepID=UPI00188FE926|nr:SDR family oxidoreductase [Nocardia sp. XZ_19_369]
MSAPAARPVAVVTGGSRGIGARVCERLAAAGFDVHFCYRQARRRAETTVARLSEHYPDAAVHGYQADITEPAALAEFAATVAESGSPVTALVLNASGGMERDAAPGYADVVNGDAQVAVLEAFAPLLRPGAAVVYLTSVQSHGFGTIDEFDSYYAIARSKHRGEQLVGQWCRTNGRAIALTTVVSDMVEGTPAALLMDLREPAASEDRRRAALRSGADLPTVDAVARQVELAVLAERAPGSWVDYVVGGAVIETFGTTTGSGR